MKIADLQQLGYADLYLKLGSGRSKTILDRFLGQYLLVGAILGKLGGLVKGHKSLLGQQDLTYFNGEFRFHVWAFENYIVQVNNNKGICIEVHPDLDQQGSLACWLDYTDRLAEGLKRRLA